MAYTVLARRYRSSTFDDLVGQPQIAQTLARAIITGRLAHAFLFCGTRGTGKTSTARILAKCLNCQSHDAPTVKPCGKCSSCEAIARGDDIDVIEIDAASNTGVDNVRDLIANSQFRPARSRFKIYIIDEAHMLSKSAFNALLKTLEEPPPHVKFILATTEPEKIPATILSRCQRYDFRNIPTREIAEHLRRICASEKVEADGDALLAVAKAGAGSMRDALSLLDRLLSAAGNNLTADDVQHLLGLPKPQLVFDLAAAIGAGDARAALAGANSLIASGFSLDTLLATLSDHFRNLLILLTCGPDSDLVEAPGIAADALLDQARRFTAPVLTQDIVILEELRRTTRSSVAARALVDATIVRLALADQFLPLADLIDDDSGDPPVSAPRPAPAVPAPRSTAVQKKTPHVEMSSVEMSSAAESPNAIEEAALSDRQESKISPAAVGSIPAAEVSSDDLRAAWTAALTKAPAAAKSAFLLGHMAGIEDNRLVIRFPATHETFVKRLLSNGSTQTVSGLLSELLARPIGLRLDIDPPDTSAKSEVAADAPAAHRAEPAQPTHAESAATRAESQRVAKAPSTSTPEPIAPPTQRLTTEMRKAAEAQPFVRALLQEFSGTIVAID